MYRPAASGFVSFGISMKLRLYSLFGVVTSSRFGRSLPRSAGPMALRSGGSRCSTTSTSTIPSTATSHSASPPRSNATSGVAAGAVGKSAKARVSLSPARRSTAPRRVESSPSSRGRTPRPRPTRRMSSFASPQPTSARLSQSVHPLTALVTYCMRSSPCDMPLIWPIAPNMSIRGRSSAGSVVRCTSTTSLTHASMLWRSCTRA
mmetsp:Transcript_9853/g.31238  ORF Transcript_9853/g.31238 Transcript_9853/m.31238 type:complete len:205 (-) Transcript_9853:778-1392(-)